MAESLGTLLKKLTVPQLWAIGGAMVALLGGAFTFGVFVQSVRNDSVLLEKNREIGTLKLSVSEKDRLVAAAVSQANLVTGANDLARVKIAFLHQFVTYFQAPGKLSKNLFVDMVCSMWKDSASRNVHVNRQPLALTVSDLRAGLAPEVKELLIRRGLSPAMFDQITGTTATDNQNIDVQRLAANVEKLSNGVNLIKTVSFGGGPHYTLPQEISAAVHLRSDCGPRP